MVLLYDTRSGWSATYIFWVEESPRPLSPWSPSGMRYRLQASPLFIHSQELYFGYGMLPLFSTYATSKVCLEIYAMSCPLPCGRYNAYSPCHELGPVCNQRAYLSVVTPSLRSTARHRPSLRSASPREERQPFPRSIDGSGPSYSFCHHAKSLGHPYRTRRNWMPRSLYILPQRDLSIASILRATRAFESPRLRSGTLPPDFAVSTHTVPDG